ncbi:MAG: STAS domain-containing protein [Acidobacteriota bacterium]|nr:STAS domain-containing protein [Acidobacteriota bacterium]
MATSFSVQRSSSGGITILALSGFLDAHTAPEFENAVQQEFDAGNVRLVADCGALTYISSAGLGVFMSFIEDIRAANGDLKICSLAPKVAQVFEILGFNSIFEIVPGVDDAARSFAGFATEA